MQELEDVFSSNTKNCYIGIRESDTAYSGRFFSKAIAPFSSRNNTDSFCFRPNQNLNGSKMLAFCKELATNTLALDTLHFVFYNQATAYYYPNEILSRSVCLNSQDILLFLNNKLTLRDWLSVRKVPVIPYKTMQGNEIQYTTLTQIFRGYSSFVIQSCHGGGGIGTYLATENSFCEIESILLPLQTYIVSPYYANTVSANTHLFISDKQTVLSPGSIQIIELHKNQLCYRGGDFPTFRKLPSDVREEIKRLSFEISTLLRGMGYRGIAGVDFIIDDQKKVYISEINPRFQASSLLIDRFLQEKKRAETEAASTFELNEMAFQGTMITTLCFEDIINYSCYYYYHDDGLTNYFKKKFNIYCQEGIVFSDGIEGSWEALDENSYLYRAIFPHAISNISPDMTLWISDNIRVLPIPKDYISLKIALLNQGVRIDKSIINAKKGAYESIDISLDSSDLVENISGQKVNCAVGIHLSQYSPYFICKVSEQEVLYYYDVKIADITVEKDPLFEFTEKEKKMLFIATDRLRIKLIQGCENKNAGKGCKFCNVPVSKGGFSQAEYRAAFRKLLERNVQFRHILIGGGTCLSDNAWNQIIALCKEIKDAGFGHKEITLMSIVPPIDILPKLKDAGINETAFNIEVSNQSLAKYLMPGKHENGKDEYYSALKAAVNIFGVGHVRSALIVGLDREKDIYNEIITLASLGVQPCLSAFRSLPNTEFEGDIPPENLYLLRVLEQTEDILSGMSTCSITLGPNCADCCNNMLRR